jgi:mannose-6-phosphate isomerase-like protein (cupin superfamily)
MEYLRKLDPDQFDVTRFSVLTLAGRDSDSEHCLFRVARVPVGVGSGSAGGETPHTHTVDKFYYVLSGVMTGEIDGEPFVAEPNTLVFVPANVPHRNWNEGPEVELHIVLFVPEPAPGTRIAIPVTG